MIPSQLGITYHAQPPEVRTIAPASGSTAGGTPITLTGSGFLTTKQVMFGGTNVPTFTVVNDTTITFNAPAHAAQIINCTVRNDYRTSAPGGVFTYVSPVVPGSNSYSSGNSQTYTVRAYNTLTIELWGGGAQGSGKANADDGNASTCAAYGLIAGGGFAASTNTANSGAGAGLGGTASGGNNTNATGGAGGTPTPTNVSTGLSGRGGSAPNGGAGGAPVAAAFTQTLPGNPGSAPGGGGSGYTTYAPTAGGSMFKYPGGGSGGYVQHVFTAGMPGAPAVGTIIRFNVGTGGNRGNAVGGPGAAGGARFTVA